MEKMQCILCNMMFGLYEKHNCVVKAEYIRVNKKCKMRKITIGR